MNDETVIPFIIGVLETVLASPWKRLGKTVEIRGIFYVIYVWIIIVNTKNKKWTR